METVRQVSRGRTNFCAKHGGGTRCRVEGCQKSALGKLQYCKLHHNALNSGLDQEVQEVAKSLVGLHKSESNFDDVNRVNSEKSTSTTSPSTNETTLKDAPSISLSHKNGYFPVVTALSAKKLSNKQKFNLKAETAIVLGDSDYRMLTNHQDDKSRVMLIAEAVDLHMNHNKIL
jgi:hypothetical protein